MNGIVYFLIIGAVAGWLAGQVWKGGGFGLGGNLLVGIIGSVLGGYLFGVLGITTGGLIGSIITAFAGAIVLLWIVKQLKK